MNGVVQFSIYKNLSLDTKMRGEAEAIVPFMDKLQDFVQVEDVSYQIPDPPDFVIKAAGKKIGMELTKSNPKQFGNGGFKKIGEFKKWQQEAKRNPLPRHEFEWGEFTLKESLAAFQEEVERKSKRAKIYSSCFDESWLVLQAEGGSSLGGLAEGAYASNRGHKETVLDYAGKNLYEMCRICKTASPFNLVLLFCGPNILALPVLGSAFKLPIPDNDLLQRGEKASEDFLNWKSKMRSITRHYDESQGDIDTWFKNSQIK